MKYKKALVLLTIILAIGMTGCGGEPSAKACAKDINKALEKSVKLKSGVIETTIAQGSYYPKDAPLYIETEFEKEGKKDIKERNIAFTAKYTYEDKNEEISTTTNYEGLYLNVYYPFERINGINIEYMEDTIDYITVNEFEKGKEYFVYYKASHMSRRTEWEYCKVSKDYEYYLLDKEGVIIQYTSNTTYKEKDKKTSEWIDGESSLTVKLHEYELL